MASQRILIGRTARKGLFRKPPKRHTEDQIVAKLRIAGGGLGKGKKVLGICKRIEVPEQTYQRWRQKYGGMKPEMARQLKALEKENARLKQMAAEQALAFCLGFIRNCHAGADSGAGPHGLVLTCNQLL